MNEIFEFVKKTEKRTFFIQNKELELVLEEGVFPPSTNGSFVARKMVINPGEKVADVGTGTGIIAILAAKLGGIVVGTDISFDSVRLAKNNSILNKVSCNFFKTEYLDSFQEKFDVIIANLPQDIVPRKYVKNIGNDLFETISGGEQGNKHIIKFLKKAKKYMHSNTRLYLPVYTDVIYKPIFKEIINNYSYTVIAVEEYETRNFVRENIGFFLGLRDKGKINIFLKNGKWHAKEYLFEIKLKKDYTEINKSN